MPTGWILKELNPSDLKNHSVNIEIYGTPAIDDDMLSSVKEFGVLEPIRCTKDMRVLSGHRRRQHAIAAKQKAVPVLVSRNAISDPEQVVEIVESNRQREKTSEVRAREFAKLAEAKAELNRKRKEANLRRGPNRQNADSEKRPENDQDAPTDTKEDLAHKAGFSSVRSAERAVASTKKIDEAVSRGDHEEAERIRRRLNLGNASAGTVAEKTDEIETPFDEHVLRCDTVLKAYVPKMQEFAIEIARQLGKAAGDFSPKAVERAAETVHKQFEGVRRILLNAQQKHRRKAS